MKKRVEEANGFVYVLCIVMSGFNSHSREIHNSIRYDDDALHGFDLGLDQVNNALNITKRPEFVF